MLHKPLLVLFYVVVNLRASSPGHSGSRAGKGRRACNYCASLEFEYLHRKVDAKCWLAKMTLVMTSLTLARVFQCLSIVAIVSASRWLGENWQLTRQEATGKLEVEFKFQRHSCELSFLFPPRCQRAPESLLASYAVVWVLFIVFSIFSVESFGDCTRQQH